MKSLDINPNQVAKSACNVAEKLRDHLTDTRYSFTKTGASVKSCRGLFVSFANVEKRERKEELEAEGLTDVKVSQYDAMRHFVNRNREQIQPDVEGKLYKFVDNLSRLLPGVTGRPGIKDAFVCLTILAEDWANDPRNVHIDWEDLASSTDLSDIESDN